MPSRDPYDVLGVAPDASAEEIKSVYRQLARTFHPDVNADPRAVEHFREITEAFLALSDPKARRALRRPRSREDAVEETDMYVGLRVAGIPLGGLLGVDVTVRRRYLYPDESRDEAPAAALGPRRR